MIGEVWNGFTVGPDDWLILVLRPGATPTAAANLRQRIPKALHGRVAVVDGLDAYVVKAAAAERLAQARAEVAARQPAPMPEEPADA